MTGNQVTVEEEFNGVVDRRTTYTVTLVFHVNKKRLHVEVVGQIVHLFQYAETFFRFTVIVSFQVIGENFSYGLLCFFRLHGR